MRTKIMMLQVVFFFLFVISAGSLYAADCKSGTIVKVGVNPTTSTGASPYMVQIDCANDATWPGVLQLYLSDDLGDAGLATLLTAYSLQKTVWIRTLGVTTGSIATIIYVND